MPADAEATLPALIEAVKAAIPNDRKAAIAKRGEAIRKAYTDGACECETQRGNCLGCLAHQHRPPGDGDLGADQGSRLVAGRVRGQCQLLAEPAMADGKASPLAWPLRRLRRRLRRAGLGRRRAGQPRSRPLLRVDPVRRRPDVRAGRAVDGGAAQDSALGGHAQQPRLSSGSDACAAPGEFPQPRRQCRQRHEPARHQHRESGYRISQAGGIDGMVGQGYRSRIRPILAPPSSKPSPWSNRASRPC